MPHFTNWIIASIVLVLASLVQTQPPPTVPGCVQSCLDSGFRNTGCGGGGENWQCACKKNDFHSDMTSCIRSKCANEDETEIGENMVNIGCSNILTTSLTPPFSSPTVGGDPTNTTEFPPVPTIPNPRPPGASITLPKPPITTGPPISSIPGISSPLSPTSTSSSDSDSSSRTSTRPTSTSPATTSSTSTRSSSSLSPTMVRPPVTTVSMTIPSGSIQQVPSGGPSDSSGKRLEMHGLLWTLIGIALTVMMATI